MLGVLQASIVFSKIIVRKGVHAKSDEPAYMLILYSSMTLQNPIPSREQVHSSFLAQDMLQRRVARLTESPYEPRDFDFPKSQTACLSNLVSKHGNSSRFKNMPRKLEKLGKLASMQSN